MFPFVAAVIPPGGHPALAQLGVLAAAQAGGGGATEGVLAHVLASRGVVLGVLALLVLLSLIAWFIIVYRAVHIGASIRRSRRFLADFRAAARLGELYQDSAEMAWSPAREMFRAGYEELDVLLSERQGQGGRPPGDGPAAAPGSGAAAFENIERAVAQAGRNAVSRVEYGVSFLATVGSAAPFIGLFGTVWGIMNAFADIDPSKPILETVTPHIAEALVATAIGLLAAIPAVMAYNWLVGRLRTLQVYLDDFGAEYLNILRRHFFS